LKYFEPMEHGGDVLSYKNLYDGEIIDFSSNINPLGPPARLKEYLSKSFDEVEKYPDIKYRILRENIGEYLNCEKENVVVGNGAVEIINNFIFLFKRVIIFSPAFSEYEKRAKIFNKDILKLSFSKDYRLDIDAIKTSIKEGDILVLGNPNNPTGLRIEKQELLDIYEIVLDKKAFLLLDEAFFEFCPFDYDSIDIFKKYGYERVAIIRAATKFFALPGIRFGYACTSTDMVEKCNSIGLPWSINIFADYAGRYIFRCQEYIEDSKAYIDEERRFLLEGLSQIEGIRVFPTQSNFIFIKLLKWDEDFVFDKFLKNGLLIRKCSSFFEDLDKSYIRVAIKDRNSNTKLLNSFKELESV
jgi:threonine-phosphate decarboxylase